MREFNSILSFAEHLVTIVAAEEVAIRHGLDKAAALVEKTAKDKIGEYQQQVGPFIAWPELAESTKADRAKQGYAEDEPLLRSGAMRDSIGRTLSTDGLEAQVGSNSDIAVYQELGTQHIPPRSFLGGAVAEKIHEINGILGKSVFAALIGEKVMTGGLMIEGEHV